MDNKTNETAVVNLDTWAIVELFGHTRMAGRLATITLGGASFLRLDVPESEGQPAFTRFINPSAVYAINPTSEEIARGAARAMRPEPVHRWELPKQLTAPPPVAVDGDEDDDRDVASDDPSDFL